MWRWILMPSPGISVGFSRRDVVLEEAVLISEATLTFINFLQMWVFPHSPRFSHCLEMIQLNSRKCSLHVHNYCFTLKLVLVRWGEFKEALDMGVSPPSTLRIGMCLLSSTCILFPVRNFYWVLVGVLLWRISDFWTLGFIVFPQSLLAWCAPGEANMAPTLSHFYKLHSGEAQNFMYDKHIFINLRNPSSLKQLSQESEPKTRQIILVTMLFFLLIHFPVPLWQE